MPITPITPLQIVKEHVQFTDGLEPVAIQFRAASRTGVFARSSLCHTTQTALIARIPAEIRDAVGDRWGDAESSAELLDSLAANGITAEIVSAVPVGPRPGVS